VKSTPADPGPAGPPEAGRPGAGPGSGSPEAGRAGEAAVAATPWRLWDHIGVLSGVMLGLVFAALLGVLAAAGDPAALSILVTIAIGVAMIFLGVKMRGSTR